MTTDELEVISLGFLELVFLNSFVFECGFENLTSTCARDLSRGQCQIFCSGR